MENLYRIRYYGKRYDPYELKTKGWRGWWIWLLNEVRFRVELRVMRQVLIFQAKKLGDLADLNAAMETFESDVQPMRQHIKDRPMLKTDPPFTGSVQGHLKEMRKPGRVQSLSDITARTMNNYAAGPRQRRYVMNRAHRVMMEAETLGETTHGQDTDVPSESPSSSDRSEPAFRLGKARPVHPEYGASILTTEAELSPEDGEAEDPLAAERVAGAREDYYRFANAAEEHQRSILSRGVRTSNVAEHQSYRRPDDAGAERPEPADGTVEEHRAEEGGTPTAGDEGAEARTGPTERTI